MVFYKKNDIDSSREEKGNVILNNEVVELVPSFKYLGVIIDTCLSFKQHCSMVESKLNASLSKVYSIRRMIPTKFLKTIISAYLSSIIDYGLLFWGVPNESEVNSFQRKIDRLLITYFYGKKSQRKSPLREFNINGVYEKLNILTINERIVLYSINFVIRWTKSELFKDWFSKSRETETTFSLLKTYGMNSETGKCSIRYHCIVVWNKYCKTIDKETKKYMKKLKDDATSCISLVDICKNILVSERNQVFVPR